MFLGILLQKLLKDLPLDKTTAGEIPVNVLKNSEICFLDLTNHINEAIRNNESPDSLKVSNITIDQPVFYYYYRKYLKKLSMSSFMNF